MYALLLGVLLMLLKYLEIGPVANWSWWWVLSPFAVAAAWWAWADATGYTKRKAMEKMDQRKQEPHQQAQGSPGHANPPPALTALAWCAGRSPAVAGAAVFCCLVMLCYV